MIINCLFLIEYIFCTFHLKLVTEKKNHILKKRDMECVHKKLLTC